MWWMGFWGIAKMEVIDHEFLQWAYVVFQYILFICKFKFTTQFKENHTHIQKLEIKYFLTISYLALQAIPFILSVHVFILSGFHLGSSIWLSFYKHKSVNDV